MRSNYLDMYDGVHEDEVYINRFDDSSDLSTTYLGKTSMTRESKSGREISHIRTGLYFGKIVRWH